MRKRDLAILMLCAFAIFFSLQHEGDFSFREAWFHLSEEYPIKFEAERLPPPIVADLNGDGKKEILVATHDAKIQVLEAHDRRVDEGFSEARVLTEVTLLPDKIRVASGRRAVAMATGVVDRFYKPGQVQKQVLVVVTSGWSVMCFDHNLKKLWETNLQEDFPHNAHHREIAISITNYTLKHGDAGLVIVGGRMEMQPHMFVDPFEEIGMAEKNAEQHRRSANENEASENSGTVDIRHFAFYAFAGRTGTLRWSRKNENVEAHSSDASQLIPQHNYKLDAHALNSRHPGEFECREFRESILGVMPHQWDRREDTLLKLAHFRRHKRKTLKKTSGKTTNYPFHKPEENHPPGKDSTKKISNLIGKAAKYAGSAKSKKPMTYIPTITNYTQLWWVPNVVVAHQKEGIEAVHLASGRTICKLHLQEGGLHADINGDGVLDHVQVVGGNGAEQTVVSGSMEVLRPCWAVATSGVPVREQLFNASICHYSHFNFFQHGDFSRSFGHNLDVSSLEVATPILLPRSDGHRHRKGSHGDVIFLTNRGEVTSYAPGLHGHDAVWQWQLVTGATWSNLPSPSGMMEAGMVVPTLKAFSLRVHDNQELILAAGDQEAVVLSPGGSILTSVVLPAPPTHALICDDFSNDGLTDLILVTSSGVYGFVQNHPFSSSSLETTPNQHSFAVNYFINSCGFPLEKAISASNYVKFETPNKPDSVLAFLENRGFTKTQITNLVRKYPPVILCDPEKTILPKFQFFKSKDISSTDVVKILSSEPSILKRSLENTIIPSFNLLKKLTDSPVEIIKRCARVLFFDLQVSVVPNIEILRDAGVPNAKIVSFVKYEPRRFMTTSDRFRKIVNEVKKMGFNPVSLKFVIAFQAVSSMSKSTWEKKVEVYKKWGWSEDEILVAFEKYPWCMMASKHKIMRVMEFFVNKMGWDSSFLARSPILIGFSLEKRIVPRCAVYHVLLSKGLIKNNNFNLANMLKKPEKWFLKKVVNCHEEEAPGLLKLYKEKLALAKLIAYGHVDESG